MIHCIGDSHSSVFSGEEVMQPIWPQRSNDCLEFFRSYRIGAATAYQLQNKVPLINQLIMSTNILEGDSLMFCFGEVDIRAHLIKQASLQDKSVLELVKECTQRYIGALQEFRKYNLPIIVWGPIASWVESKPYTGGPSFGSNIERNLVTEEFNFQLKIKCQASGFSFISLFEEMTNKKGETMGTFLDDWDGCHMHLSQRAMPAIIEKFKSEGLIPPMSKQIKIRPLHD